ncbi:MAG: asparagine synthase (glutamine-hydrolyzing) [Salinivirgaceae bacterium]|nr:asparagine synthase (glutamine-hydrolyzing) [Salinivirgaceae bacterium]
MCGIAGFFSSNNYFFNEELSSMINSLSHRGPDAAGTYFHENLALGHRRLSIIDLSDMANQPMTSHSSNTVIVFNGEIYNYREIAKELNFNAKTTSDTEVILEAFEKWGPDFVNRLNGMFAIAIYKISENKLYLFRDRIGIKPLFYYLVDGQLAFASELKAITKLFHFKQNKHINQSAINKFLHLGYIPAPETIYSKVYKFPQGNYAVFDGAELNFTEYWNSSKQIKANCQSNFSEAKAELNYLIEDSVKYRLIADVPYGTFLSGGVDSSLVTAMAQKITNHQLKTFSIGFEDSKYNESAYARKVSKHLETDHHEYILSEKEALNLVDDIWNYYDEPYADSSALPTMLVSKMAKEQVTMTLSGDGGDELFFGYGMYQWAKRLNNPLVWNSRFLSKQVLNQLNPKYQRVSHLFDIKSKKHLNIHIFSQEQYFFSQKELKNISLNSENYFELFKLNNEIRNLSASEKQALFDLNYYLPDDLLTKVDRASMKYSLESRVPLLDHRIVEFALNLDPNLKVKNGVSKFLLKEVLYDYVPKEIFDRPKWGFASPINKWLKTDLKYLIDDYLNESMLIEAGFVEPKITKRLIDEYLTSDKEYLYNRVWVLICLHRWYFDIYMNIK